MARGLLPVLAGLSWLAAGCATVTADEPLAAPVTEAPPPSPTTTTVPETTTAPETTAPETPVPAPTFTGTVRAAESEELSVSWREGCPVPVADLRWLELTHWDNEGSAVEGSLVVHADHAEAVVEVFRRLFDAGFPIQSMRPITHFDGDDNASMRANNTSAFNCREIDGRPGVWSQHAYGGAIDINPLVNPWVRGSQVDPPEGAEFVDRDPAVPGLITKGDVVTQAFAEIGWTWGGDWTSTLDYQHFSHNGR